tara:strand:- start:1028 stop:1507 length:480 start_codon:yes stop_codon:yes gene_type:complete
LKRSPIKRKTKLRRSAKSKTRGWYSKKLDTIAKTFAKERDKYKCQHSNVKVSGSNAHGSHVIPVSAGLILRWDLDNIKCLCHHSHINWWHKNPLESAEWFEKKFPDRWKYLIETKKKTIHISTVDLSEFYDLAKKCKDWKEYKDLYDQKFKIYIKEASQ